MSLAMLRAAGRIGAGLVGLLLAGLLLAPVSRADNKPTDTKTPEKADANPEPKSDDVPSLKRKTSSSGPFIGGYLGYREIQAELKLTQEEKQKIADTQKWHRQEEERLYTEYEKKIRDILGEERWRLLAKLVDKKREESSSKRKSKSTNPDNKTEDKPAPAQPDNERERP